MSVSLSGIIDREVYRVIIRYDGAEYLTLSYYTCADEALIHDESAVICFEDDVQLSRFCAKNDLSLFEDTFLCDFDSPITNPVGYSAVLDRWNMLNTIAGLFSMYFEGDCRKYNGLYDLLFRLCTSAVPVEPEEWLSKRHMTQLRKIFRKQERFFERFRMCVPEEDI